MPDTGIPGVPNGHPNEDDTLLNDESVVGAPDEEQDEEEEPVSRTVGEEDEEITDEEDEEKPKEDEEEEEEEEEAKELPFERPTVRDLKNAFPDIFKKFPTLKESYFREIEFTKIFPSVEDARDAVEENTVLSSLSDSALEGDPAPILESLKKTDTKAFNLFAGTFLNALYQHDKEAYQSAITPVVEGLLRNAYRQGDEETKKAAVLVAKFVFDNDGEEVAAGRKTFSKLNDLQNEQKTLKTQKAEETATKFREAASKVEQNAHEGLLQLALKQVDPNKAYSKFIRNKMAEEVVARIAKQLESDKGHRTVMASRWKRAKTNGYTNDDISKITSTFLARAKSLIPATSEKVRSLTTGGKRKTVQSQDEEERQPVRREVNGGRPPSSAPKRGTITKEQMRKMSDMEILSM